MEGGEWREKRLWEGSKGECGGVEWARTKTQRNEEGEMTSGCRCLVVVGADGREVC